jgi:hypothetical protein
VDNGWLAKRLAMGARTVVSRIMSEARERMRQVRKLKALGPAPRKEDRRTVNLNVNTICLTPNFGLPVMA